MLRYAKETFKGNSRLSESASNALNQVLQGNMNPGIGTNRLLMESMNYELLKEPGFISKEPRMVSKF